MFWRWLVISRRGNGDHILSCFGDADAPKSQSGRKQAIDLYRACKEDPGTVEVYFAENISDQVDS